MSLIYNGKSQAKQYVEISWSYLSKRITVSTVPSRAWNSASSTLSDHGRNIRQDNWTKEAIITGYQDTDHAHILPASITGQINKKKSS